MAILLLTAPLMVGRREAAFELLTLSEYNRLARLLREEQRQPSDLIGPDAREVIDLCSAVIDRARLESLLGRGFLLSQAVDRWSARAIWVVSRADPAYPRRLKARLKEDAPPVLYGCGETALMETGGLAVVGSRHVDDELIAYSENVGRVAADAQRTLISGGARGVDQAAMHGALKAGGAVVGVLADSLERAALARDNREPLMNRRLALVSPYDPAAGFNVGHAMSRNKLIYAIADAAVVVNSDFEKGGTWAGRRRAARTAALRARVRPERPRCWKRELGPPPARRPSMARSAGRRGTGRGALLGRLRRSRWNRDRNALPFDLFPKQPVPPAEEPAQPAGAGVRDPGTSRVQPHSSGGETAADCRGYSESGACRSPYRRRGG